MLEKLQFIGFCQGMVLYYTKLNSATTFNRSKSHKTTILGHTWKKWEFCEKLKQSFTLHLHPEIKYSFSNACSFWSIMDPYWVVNVYKIHTVGTKAQQKKMCYGRDIFILILRLNFILKLSNEVYKGLYHAFGQEKGRKV